MNNQIKSKIYTQVKNNIEKQIPVSNDAFDLLFNSSMFISNNQIPTVTNSIDYLIDMTTHDILYKLTHGGLSQVEAQTGAYQRIRLPLDIAQTQFIEFDTKAKAAQYLGLSASGFSRRWTKYKRTDDPKYVMRPKGVFELTFTVDGKSIDRNSLKHKYNLSNGQLSSLKKHVKYLNYDVQSRFLNALSKYNITYGWWTIYRGIQFVNIQDFCDYYHMPLATVVSRRRLTGDALIGEANNNEAPVFTKITPAANYYHISPRIFSHRYQEYRKGNLSWSDVISQ